MKRRREEKVVNELKVEKQCEMGKYEAEWRIGGARCQSRHVPSNYSATSFHYENQGHPSPCL